MVADAASFQFAIHRRRAATSNQLRPCPPLITKGILKADPHPLDRMLRSSHRRTTASALLALLGLAAPVVAQVDPRLYAGITWRNLGPFRAGRIAAVSGAVGQPGVFYVGLPAGGVWKTTSAGTTWYPVFDAIKDVSSVGAI